MRLMDDYIHPTPHDGRCRERIYLSDADGDAPVVLLTELSDNPGQSVTNAAETIARQVITTHCFDEPEPVFIEHYEDGGRGSSTDSHTFDLVRFKTYTLIESSGNHAPAWSIGTPTWKPLDRATVETLVGESIA